MKNIFDELIEKIKAKNNPTVMGLDPRYEKIPEFIRNKYTEKTDAILEYNKRLIDSVYDIIPAVKPQIAFYEIFGEKGLECFRATCKYAKSKGMIVIADIKRGDIGTTAEAYSESYLRSNYYDIDIATVNPYLGTDGIKPFVDDCIKMNKGIFVLVKTSNKSSGELQDMELKDGRKVYEAVADLVNVWGEGSEGENGYTVVGSVVGATYKEQIDILRKRMKKSFFLVPGYGAQRRKSRRFSWCF